MRRPLVLTLVLLAACGSDSGTPFDPAAADLTGTWVLTDETLPDPNWPGPAVPCEVTLDLEVTDEPESVILPGPVELFGVMAATGTGVQVCRPEGEAPVETPFLNGGYVVLIRDGENVALWTYNGYRVYTGTVVRANLMTGERDPDYQNRLGPWRAERQ
jgi:hypothetical protein